MRASIPGDAAALTDGAASVQRTADLLVELALELERVVAADASSGRSADAVRERTREAAGTLRRLEPRYTTTAAAVREFAVTLAEVQREHRDALATADEAGRRYYASQREVDEIDQRMNYLAMSNPVSEELEDLRRQRAYYARDATSAWAVLTSAEAAVAKAEEDWDAAGRAAADRIRPALEALNDSVLEQIGAVFDGAVDFLAAVAHWIAAVLDTVISTLVLAVAAILAVVIVVVLWLALSPLLAVLLLTGAAGWEDILEVFIGVAIVLVPLIFPAINYLLIKEALTPTPPVVPRPPLDGVQVRREGVDDYAYLFHNNGRLDTEGGVDSTVVEIVQVLNADGSPALDENGNPIWRVTLPSTQDWQLPGLSEGIGDHGGANDLGSNLALILSPGQQAAYERAVLQAMSDAGIGSDDSVMLVGWSQGGILAGAIASDPNSGFNVRAIVVAGSPIDHMPIPDDVSVLAFQHDSDVVPRLDGAAPRSGENWTTVNVASRGPGEVHSAESYAATAGAETTREDARADVQRVVEQQEMFFSSSETSRSYEFQEQEFAIA